MTGQGSHMPGRPGQGRNPDFLLAREVFLHENPATALCLVAAHRAAAVHEPKSRDCEV